MKFKVVTINIFFTTIIVERLISILGKDIIYPPTFFLNNTESMIGNSTTLQLLNSYTCDDHMCICAGL